MNHKRPLVFLHGIWLLLIVSCARTPQPIPTELLQRLATNANQPYSCNLVHEGRWEMDLGPDYGTETVDLEIKSSLVVQAAAESCSVQSELHSFSYEPEHELIWQGGGVEHRIHQERFSNSGAWTCSLFEAGDQNHQTTIISSAGGWSLAGQALALIQGMDADECVIDGDECQFLWSEIPDAAKRTLMGYSASRWNPEEMTTLRLNVELESGLPTFFAMEFGDAGFLKIQFHDHQLLNGNYQDHVVAMVDGFEVNEFYRCECGDIPGNPPLPKAVR